MPRITVDVDMDGYDEEFYDSPEYEKACAELIYDCCNSAGVGITIVNTEPDKEDPNA